ncbi:MAG: HAD family hydrolase [Candidatus Helarchaeota archaeon]
MKLLLFDIDGTLTTNNTAHMKAFNSVFREFFNVKDADIEKINHHGLTDELLIYMILERHNIDRKIIEKNINEARAFMIEKYKFFLKKHPVILISGVKTFLKDVYSKNALGLVTGNLEEIARIKLSSVNIWEYFYGGGFGSDSHDRYELIKIAIKRAENIYHKKFSINDIVLFGDTVRDIKAAEKLNIKIIGIAGGIYSTNELKQYGAHYVFRDFSNIKVLKEALKL